MMDKNYIQNFNEHQENFKIHNSEKELIKRLIDRLQKLENEDLSLSKLTFRLSIVDDMLSNYNDNFLKEKIIRDLNEYF
jgi:hypothetical protein